MTSKRHRAFTLVELIIVIGILALLIAIVLVSLRGLRQAAGRTDSLSTLRQLTMAYQGYCEDFDYRLLPGYIDASMMALDEPFEDLVVYAPDGTQLAGLDNDDDLPGDASSWVWRLSPYFADSWKALFADVRDPALLAKLSAEFEGDDPGLVEGDEIYGPETAAGTSGAIGLADHPGFGLNSIFLGGDAVHGGEWVTDRNPWDPEEPDEVIAATRYTQVRNPSRIILFAPTARAATTSDLSQAYADPNIGFAELRPPQLRYNGLPNQWELRQWMVAESGQVMRVAPNGEYADGAGLPIVRAGVAEYPISHLDGSAEIVRLEQIGPGRNAVDMRWWAPKESRARNAVP